MADGAAIGHLSTTGHGECGGSLRDALQFAKEVAGMGRLVVAAHLPHHTVAVLVVVPQRVVTPRRGNGSGIDADIIVARTHDELLAPVAHDVAHEAGSTLGVVVGHRTFQHPGIARARLIDGTCGILAVGVVEGLLLQVAIPVAAEVLRHTGRGIQHVEVLVLDKADRRCVVSRETYSTGDGVQEVAGNGTSVITGSHVTIVQLGCRQVTVVVVGAVLIAEEALLSVNVGVQVAMMLSIAVAKADSRQSLTVIVDDQATEDYLVAAVPVDIDDSVVVVTLTIPGRAFLVVHPAPALRQLMGSGINVECYELMTGIDATTKEDAGLAAVEIGSTEEELAGTVAVAVAPSTVEVALARLEAGTGVVDDLIGDTGHTVTVDEELLAIVGEPLRTAGLRLTIVGPRGAILTVGTDGVGLTVSHVNGGTFLQAHQHLGLSVKVPVVADNVLLVVLEVTHIGAAVDPPKHGTVELEHLKNSVFAVVTLFGEAVSTFLQVVELQQDFHLAVTIDVSTAGVVGHEGRRDGGVVLGSNLQIAVGPRLGSIALTLSLTTLDGLYGITAGSRAASIGVV